MQARYAKLGMFVVMLLGISTGYFFFNRERLQGSHASTIHVAFDESMLLKDFSHMLERDDFKAVYETCKNLYEKHNFNTLKTSKETRIPKLIHVMWLGGKLPDEFEPYVNSWRKHHPNWTVLFWTDNTANYERGSELFTTFDGLEKRLQSTRGGETFVVDATNMKFDNREFYDAAINYGEKSDILKWEIVYRFGGVYVDTDFECLQSLDQYNHTFDLYTGMQPLDTNMVQLGAALYGAIPNHPVLKACVEMIKHNQAIKQIVVKTGPIHFTKVFAYFAGKTGLRDVALPAGYFYPCGYEQRGTPKNEWCKKESSAVHHWAGSWLKPEAFVRA